MVVVKIYVKIWALLIFTCKVVFHMRTDVDWDCMTCYTGWYMVVVHCVSNSNIIGSIREYFIMSYVRPLLVLPSLKQFSWGDTIE
jgi:cytochrome c oxidase subunit IV